jgi:hypothetical protein
MTNTDELLLTFILADSKPFAATGEQKLEKNTSRK